MLQLPRSRPLLSLGWLLAVGCGAPRGVVPAPTARETASGSSSGGPGAFATASTGGWASSSSATAGSSSGSTGSGGSGSTGGAMGGTSGASSGGSAVLALHPNDAVSVEAVVDTQGATAVQVRCQARDGGPTFLTPAWPTDGGVVAVPVLGLLPATDYDLTALLVWGDGGSARSAPWAFSTPALPSIIPTFTVVVPDGGAPPPGFTLLARVAALGSSGPQPVVIVDGTGRVVWYLIEAGLPNADFQRQPDGTFTVALRDPSPLFNGGYPALFDHVDALGRHLGLLALPRDGGTDSHDLRILPGGDLLFIGDEERVEDLTRYGGSATNAVVGNSLWRLHPDGGVAFTWSSFDHLTVEEMSANVPQNTDPVDAVHMNALVATADGNYLASARHLSQVMKIDGTTGDFLWRLGGENSTFTFPDDPFGGPSFQHAPVELPGGDLLLFDNGNDHVPQQSRAVEYALDLDAGAAHLVWQYAPPGTYAFAMGSAVRLPGGNTLVSFGTAARVDEVDPAGNLVWSLTEQDAIFGVYRAYRLDSLD